MMSCRRVITSVVALVVVAATGCGTSEQNETGQPAEPVTTASPPPGTALAVPPSMPDVAVTSVADAEITEPCPVSASVAPETAEADRLTPMLGVALQYGQQHAAEFGSYGLVWRSSNDASVFISFTTNVEGHRRALLELVDQPDDLIVCQVAVNNQTAQDIYATLGKELEGRFRSIGLGSGAVQVDLNPNEEALAAELVERYGAAVEVTVGSLAFPLEAAVSTCPPPPDANQLPGLDITIRPPIGPISASASAPLQLTIDLTNVGETPISFLSGAATGTILDSSGAVVADGAGAMTLSVGIGVDLLPGASTELPLTVSLASCDTALGYTLPPGEYQLLANVQHSDGEVTMLRSNPAPITIVD